MVAILPMCFHHASILGLRGKIAHAMAGEYTVDQVAGAQVRALRVNLGLSQAELGEVMRRIGFEGWRHRQTVVEVEAGNRRLSWDELFALAAFFEMPPATLLVGGTVSYAKVRLAGRLIEGEHYGAWWGWSADRPAPKPVQQAIDHLLYGRAPKRSWAERWRRRRRGGPDLAYIEARRDHLDSRSKPAGPTFVSDEDFQASEGLPAFGEVKVELKAGVPYTARDEAEAAVLRSQEALGKVRRIGRHEARRMREEGR
jgi:transcriptional regulator with XRE-family HTH domain